MGKWKALSSATLIAALVMAPMGMGAYADEGTPPDQPVTDSVAAPSDTAEAPADTAQAPADTAQAPADTDQAPADTAQAPADAPSASTQEVAAAPAAASYPQPTPTPTPGLKVYVCKYVGTPGVDERLQTGQNPIDVSVNAIPADATVGSFFNDQHGRSYVLAFDEGQPEPDASMCPPGDGLIEVTPMLSFTPPSCTAAGVLTLGPAEGVVWSAVLNDDGSTRYNASPADGYTFPEHVQTEWTVPDLTQLAEDSDDCIVPVPALFAAEPMPPTCDTAGALPDLSEVFAHVTLAFDRPFDGPGMYTLTATAESGYEFPSGETQVSRDITVSAAIGFQSTDPEAPCFRETLTETTLMPPMVEDHCGTDNDGAFLPDDTDGIVYSWVDENDPDNFDVLATVQPGFVVNVIPDGWVANEDGTFTYAWSPEFSDDPCLIPGGIASQCVGSVPYLGYSVSLPEGFEPDSDTPLTITFLHPTDPSQDYVVSNLPLTGTLLWPGASATPPLQWPGWMQLADGSYVETEGNYAWTRAAAGVTVLFEVNPSYDTVVTYPAESAICANPASALPPAPASAPAPPALASTGGADMMPWGVGAAAMLVAGTVLMTMRRFARR